MAKIVVEVCKIDKIVPHPNADKLEIACIRGWECIVPKERYVAGSLVVYFPPDTLLPIGWAEKFGVTKYLAVGSRYEGFGRVRSTSLRGYHSMGLVVDLGDPEWKEGQDVSEFYGVEKYDPPPPKASLSGGDIVAEMGLFPVYTEIENLRNYPNAFDEVQVGMPVVITEKIHGSNCRVALIDGKWYAGSHEKRRRNPIPERKWPWAFYERIGWLKPLRIEDHLDLVRRSTYWAPLANDALRDMMIELSIQFKQVVVYGELYGAGCQKGFAYDAGQERKFRVFDIMTNGTYWTFDEIEAQCKDCDVETVPALGRGTFSMDLVKSFATGKTTLTLNPDGNIREGVVVRPVEEVPRHPKIGRLILKYISDEYLALKEKKADVEVKDV